MKIITAILFILIYFICFFYWYQARKELNSNQKKKDSDLTIKQDLLCLCTLLIGYILIYLYPYQLTIWIYCLVAFLIGIVMELHYFQYLKKLNFSIGYTKKAIIFSAILYYLTVSVGMLLLIWE
jgi:divalent metal cation (Fe/Co/Zn/Cd) transporter